MHRINYKRRVEVAVAVMVVAAFSAVGGFCGAQDVSSSTPYFSEAEPPVPPPATSQPKVEQANDPSDDWDGAICAAFSPDGKLLATGMTEGRSIFIWDSQSGKQQRTLSGRFRFATSLAFSPDSKRLVAGLQGSDENAICWNVETGERLFKMQGHGCMIVSTAFSPDGKQIATGECDGDVTLWDAQSGRKLDAAKKPD
jgi:WD40 repeat protein